MKPTRTHPPTPYNDKENAAQNGRSSPGAGRLALVPSTNPASPRAVAPLYSSIRKILRIAESSPDKAQLLNLTMNRNLLSMLQAAVVDPVLRTHVAHLFSLLSVEHDAADLLSQPPFVPLLDNLLHTKPPHPTLRHAARAVRNVTAHSAAFAHALARHSRVIRRLIILLRIPGQPDADITEIAAGIANFARCGLQCQAYARKHGSLAALAEAAMATGDATRFHACRALAEYSLEHKWLVQLVAEGCVGIMLRVLERDADEEIVSEATRFLGNLGTSKVGREAALGSGAIEPVVARVLTLSESSQLFDLRTDLLRTTANLCVNSKDAATKVIALGGLTAFVDAYAIVKHPNLQTEAFRGLLIIAQATHAARAAVLREIGIKIRQDASHGRCVAALYDLSRRIKVEASAEQKDDFPQTIADLGARSKQYLFRAGPLASPNTPEREDDTAHTVPDMQSASAAAFRQSGRLLSVQRPVLHRDRLERERRERGPKYMGVPSPVEMSEISASDSAHPDPGLLPVRRDLNNASPAMRSSTDRRPTDEAGAMRVGAGRATSEPGYGNQNVDAIPRCRVIEGSKQQDGSPSHWIKAVWSAVCSAVSRPPNGPHSSPSPAASPSKRESPGVYVNSDGEEEDVYEMGVPLGRGGFATVFLAKNLRTAELVAVKRFHPPNSASHDDVNKKAEVSLRRAIKEQRIWDGLTHKNIVSYKGCFFGEQGELNLVAEYIPGWSLADHLSQITRFPEHMVACITLQIVAGLDYLHKNGVTHRDVKPANILVNPDGVIKITDFGVSSAVDVPTMTGNTLVGTPWYIAPEMIEGRPYSKSVDIWSLGCTVIELATGKRPYHHLRPHIAMFRMTQDRMPPIPKKLSPQLRDFLKTCWVWDPAQRPTPAHLKRHAFLASVSRPEVTNLKNMTRKAG